jgi:hypothetical protein
MPVAVAHRSLFSPLVVSQRLVWHLYEHQSARQCLYSIQVNTISFLHVPQETHITRSGMLQRLNL